MDLWQNLPLRVKGFITTVLPITAIVVSGIFSFVGNQSRAAIEADIQRKFRLVTTFNDVITLMVNAETGMRGYQLTKREEFLQPYETAKNNLPAEMSRLQNLVEAEPERKGGRRKSPFFPKSES